MIKQFQGEYRWLSNFWPCQITIFPSVENAYQAMKTLDKKQWTPFYTCTAGQAKRLGKTIELRKDWNICKLEIMEVLLRYKFNIPELKVKLLATGNQELQEGNYWHDYYWGVCNGKGENNLGKLLMKIRSELNEL